MHTCWNSVCNGPSVRHGFVWRDVCLSYMAAMGLHTLKVKDLQSSIPGIQIGTCRAVQVFVLMSGGLVGRYNLVAGFMSQMSTLTAQLARTDMLLHHCADFAVSYGLCMDGRAFQSVIVCNDRCNVVHYCTVGEAG